MPIKRCIFCEGMGHRLLSLGYYLYSHAECYDGPPSAGHSMDGHRVAPCCPCDRCEHERFRGRVVAAARSLVVDQHMRGESVHDIVASREVLGRVPVQSDRTELRADSSLRLRTRVAWEVG